MIKINLNPEKRKKREKKGVSLSFSDFQFSNGVYLLLFALPIIATLVYLYIINSSINSLTEEKNSLIKEKQKYQKVANKIRKLNKEVSRLRKTLEELEQVKLVYENLPKEKGLFLKIFASLSRSLPDGVWVSNMQISRNSSTFRGFAFKPEYISSFYNNLINYYSDVNFSSVEKKQTKLNDYYTFQFTLSGFINKPKEEK